jgi:hypothetical protein
MHFFLQVEHLFGLVVHLNKGEQFVRVLDQVFDKHFVIHLCWRKGTQRPREELSAAIGLIKLVHRLSTGKDATTDDIALVLNMPDKTSHPWRSVFDPL